MSLRRLLIVFFVFSICSSALVEDCYAQNPKQTKKRKKRMKKKQKRASESLDYSPRKKRDKDGDGVPDYYDHCPDTPPGQTVTTFGCPPDADGDGIFDYEDDCVDVPGPKRNKGCPDKDTDGDGILDRNDHCVNTPGESRFFGCPDTDGDGVPDSKDKCIDTPGLKALNGCPKGDEDTDGDGIPNSKDKCIMTPGVASNNGCPELKPEEKAALEHAFDNLLFETGKDVIKPSSYTSLNELGKVVVNNPAIKLLLDGHTDNVGDDQSNMQLSINRAKSVKQYLVDYGVSSTRIKATGHGETQPVDSNDTAEGRENNRRVEMELYYD